MFTRRPSRVLARVLLACAVLTCADAAHAHAPRVERVVVVMRHGVRAPIIGEAPEGTLTGDPWPKWPVAPEDLTPRGAQALEILGQADRTWFAELGVLPRTGCPAPGQVSIWTNTAQRTIASGEAFAEGLAPGCGLAVGHLQADKVDPLFEPLRASAAPFDPAAAIASIQAYTGGVDGLAKRLKPQLDELDSLLGCDAPQGCQPQRPSGLKASADGRGVDLSGPIRDASGTAQVLLLQYAEGLSPSRDAWRKINPAALRRVGALHAALFDVFTRAPYMTARQAGPLARRVLSALQEPGRGVEIFVGHDTNVTALAAALGVELEAPGYAVGDVAPGGALILMSVVDEAGRRSVRVYHQTQSPTALRRLEGKVSRSAVKGQGYDQGSLPLDALSRRLSRVLADVAPAGSSPPQAP